MEVEKSPKAETLKIKPPADGLISLLLPKRQERIFYYQFCCPPIRSLVFAIFRPFRQAHNLKVVGSNPTPATINNFQRTFRGPYRVEENFVV